MHLVSRLLLWCSNPTSCFFTERRIKHLFFTSKYKMYLPIYLLLLAYTLKIDWERKVLLWGISFTSALLSKESTFGLLFREHFKGDEKRCVASSSSVLTPPNTKLAHCRRIRCVRLCGDYRAALVYLNELCSDGSSARRTRRGIIWNKGSRCTYRPVEMPFIFFFFGGNFGVFE